MSAIFLPRRWRHQPQGAVEVDTSSSLARGLCTALLPTSSGLYETARGAVRFPTGANLGISTGADGLSARRISATTQYWDLEPSGNNPTTGPFCAPTDRLSLLVLFDRFGNVSGNSPIFGNLSPSHSPYESWALVDGSGTGTASFRYSAPGNVVRNASGAISGTGRKMVIASRGATDWIRVNGSVVYSGATTSGSINYFNGGETFPRGAAFGNYYKYTGANRAANIAGYLACLWDRELSADESLALEENPWQIFRAPSHRIYFDLGAASGTTYNDSLTESVTPAESLGSTAVFDSIFSESASVAEGFAGAQIHVSALSEGVTAADSVAGALSFADTLSESVTTGDSAGSAQTHAAAVSEAITPDDSAATTQSHVEALAESVTPSDGASSAQTMPAALAEGVTAGDSLADEVVPAGSFNETIAESATLEDAYASAQTHVDALAEQVGLGDGYEATGGTEVVTERHGAPIGPPLRFRYSARIGGRMVYANSQQALQAAIREFEVSVPARAEKKAQTAGKVVVRRLPRVQVVEAPEPERNEVRAVAKAANDRIAAEYISALQAQIAIRAAMEAAERDDREAITVLEFL